MVFDIDGTRERLANAPAPDRRTAPCLSSLDEICAPGYRGRNVGKWCAPAPSSVRPPVPMARQFWRPARNGSYRVETAPGLAAIARYLAAQQLPSERVLLHIFGQYGTERCLLTWLVLCPSEPDPFLSASTHRLVAYSPVRIPSEIRPISDLQKIDSAALSGGDCASKRPAGFPLCPA